MKTYRVAIGCALWSLATLSLMAQTNRVVNFSFETVDPAQSSLAQGWSANQWGGYSRVSLPPASGGWDGNFAAEVKNTSTTGVQLRGALQRVVFNQTVKKPILITMRVRGANIQDVSTDKYGASLYCRVTYTDGTVEWCPTTAKTKNVGTFGWRFLGYNTDTLPNGKKLIQYIDVGFLLGAVQGTAYFDDVHVAEYDPGVFRGAVTFMPDDGFKEQYTFVYPVLTSYGFVGSIAAVTNFLSSGDNAYMNWNELIAMRNGGWEVVSHSVSHTDMSTLSPVAMEDEYYWSKRRFADNGIAVKSFVLPFGGYNASVLGLNEERGYYSSIRKVERGYNPVGSFAYDIKVEELKAGVTLDNVYSWVQEAAARKSWLVILFHKVRVSCADEFCVSETLFRNTATAVQNSTLPVVTYEEGLTLVKAVR